MSFVTQLSDACRLIIVIGKGGVGKTTIASALALQLAREGKRILLCAVRDSQVLEAQLGIEPLGPEPRRIGQNLEAACLKPLDLAGDYVKRFVPRGFIARRIVSSRLYRYFINLAPAIKELLLVNRLRELEQEGDETGRYRYDHVILDSPPAGHGAVLLRIPKTTAVILRAGPFREMADKAANLLTTPERTQALIVTLAEELPVNETLELRDQLLGDLDIGLAGIVANAVQPDPFPDPEVRSSYYDLLEREALWNGGPLDTLEPLVEAVEDHRSWRILQQKELDRLRAAVDEPMTTVPMSNHLTIGREALGEMGRELASA